MHEDPLHQKRMKTLNALIKLYQYLLYQCHIRVEYTNMLLIESTSGPGPGLPQIRDTNTQAALTQEEKHNKRQPVYAIQDFKTFFILVLTSAIVFCRSECCR